MERLETIVVQLEECRRLILTDRIPHLRIALILLDNAAEVLMQRRVKDELMHDELYARLHKSIDDFHGATAAEKAAQKAKIGYFPLTESREWKLGRYFAEKAEFLSRDRSDIPKETADVLTYLHRYRNEAQHDDHVRPGSLRPAVLALYSILCDLLASFGMPLMYSIGSQYEWALAYEIDPSRPGSDAAVRIAAKLREGLPLDIRQIRESLAGHLEDRLNRMIESLDFIDEKQPHDETLKEVQFWNEDRRRNPKDRSQIFTQFRPARTMESVATWRQRAGRLRDFDDKLALFREFADVEKEMEPLENLIDEVFSIIDELIQLQLDIERGK